MTRQTVCLFVFLSMLMFSRQIEAQKLRQADSLQQALEEVKGKNTEIKIKGITYTFCWCPPGTFMMGSPPNEAGRDDDDETQHKVTLSKGFWMLSTEVTHEMWESVTGNSLNPYFEENKLCPVEDVSWNDCQAFISKLNDLCGTDTLGVKFVLPTESQWEYACRAGTTGPYGGTGVLDAMGWYKDNSDSESHPVGLKNPNAWGLYDMHGNALEWCSDWFGDYPSGAVTDPTGPKDGTSVMDRGGGLGFRKVYRGGNWDNITICCRSAYRGWYGPPIANSAIGFRLCLISSEENRLPALPSFR